jgi:hypothetical protein
LSLQFARNSTSQSIRGAVNGNVEIGINDLYDHLTS